MHFSRHTAPTLLLLALAYATAFAKTHEISPSAKGGVIARAIASASTGDTLRLRAGVYKEHDIVVGKPLHILAARGDELRVIIDAELRGSSMVFVRANGVTMRGLALRNVPISYMNDNAAIRVEGAQNGVFENLRIDNALFGIYLATSANCRIAGNVLRATKGNESSSGNGIHLWKCDNITVEGNDVQGHRDGIYLEFNRRALVRRNTSQGNMRYGLHFMFSDSCAYESNTFRQNGSGVAVMYSRFVRMTGNKFEQNWGAAAYGVLFKDITDSYMAENRFFKNTTGLYAEGVNRTIIERNEFVNNGWAMKIFGSATDNIVRFNNIIGNSFDVATNSFDNENQFIHNYWSRYEGYDLDRNGIGDVPFHPVRLFSVLVEQQQSSLVLMHSLLVTMLDVAERVIPSLTPETLVDAAPMMKRIDIVPEKLFITKQNHQP
ncbi:MAG: nitrous oxide reductase family maturation protein NosD [Candidatus Kapaibacterium sp.]|nr:MAG: nitrous oxide reductase family maturation protein NosD [Candidatus Kapabacteria bacterium]